MNIITSIKIRKINSPPAPERDKLKIEAEPFELRSVPVSLVAILTFLIANQFCKYCNSTDQRVSVVCCGCHETVGNFRADQMENLGVKK